MARVAIVTGGTGALGQAVTLRLMAEGVTVAVPWRDVTERDALLARVPLDDHARLFLAECDVTDPGAMGDFAGSVNDHLGRIDILVTTVGGFTTGSLTATDVTTWNTILTLNLSSAFIAARAVVPWMRANGAGGRIVMVSSRAVMPPGAGFVAYTVAKTGVLTLTHALAAELRADGITVNAVLPSTLDTPANRAAMPDADARAWTPVESVADAIAFLVRPESAHVTDTLLAI